MGGPRVVQAELCQLRVGPMTSAPGDTGGRRAWPQTAPFLLGWLPGQHWEGLAPVWAAVPCSRSLGSCMRHPRHLAAPSLPSPPVPGHLSFKPEIKDSTTWLQSRDGCS